MDLRIFGRARTHFLALAALAAAIPGCAAVRLVSIQRGPDLPAFRIAAPTEHAVLQDGNLFIIQGEVPPPDSDSPERIEVSFDVDDQWRPAAWDPANRGRWSFLWEDPNPGFHRIRARRLTSSGTEQLTEAISVEVRDASTKAFAIDNPYSSPGQFRKGQLHVHSTHSFDGWTSLPPAELAREYQTRGYAFIAITDHDVVSRVNQQLRGFLAIPAYESTSESGHITGLWTNDVSSPSLAAQARLDHITAQGGMAILNHPGWRVGWNGADFARLKGYFGFEIYNGVTSTDLRAERNVKLWHELLNAKGWANRAWAIAVDDAHEPRAIDRGWIEAKVLELNHRSLRQALDRGAFYASNGPSFSVLGVSDGAITAASADASVIRFIDQDLKTVGEGAASGGSYRPTGRERWIRVEAVRPDGRTAWSQPFWLLQNDTGAS